jgi:hypothetical protein
MLSMLPGLIPSFIIQYFQVETVKVWLQSFTIVDNLEMAIQDSYKKVKLFNVKVVQQNKKYTTGKLQYFAVCKAFCETNLIKKANFVLIVM